jgi:hypothetical protein
MQTLIRNKNHIFNIKSKVENGDKSFYSHICIEKGTIDSNTISIVMTSSNRSKQTYCTLKTIANSINKNIHVVIVDDSDQDPINADVLKNYPFTIDFIKIDRATKCWHNPLVNYNIGFRFIKGGKVVIQNAEVCHIGDVLQFINNSVCEDNKYYVFDVKVSRDFDTNEQLYVRNLSTIGIYNENLFHPVYPWYQSASFNRKYHFLAALTKNTFDKIGGFSYDLTMGSCFDDDDFLLKIIARNIHVVNIFHNEYCVGGIHLFHGYSVRMWDQGVEENVVLFQSKQIIYGKYRIYVDATETIEDFDRKYINLLNHTS